MPYGQADNFLDAYIAKELFAFAFLHMFLGHKQIALSLGQDRYSTYKSKYFLVLDKSLEPALDLNDGHANIQRGQ